MIFVFRFPFFNIIFEERRARGLARQLQIVDDAHLFAAVLEEQALTEESKTGNMGGHLTLIANLELELDEGRLRFDDQVRRAEVL